MVEVNHSFGEEVISRAIPAQTWIASYTNALRATSMGPVSQAVVVEDSRFIGDRIFLPTDDARWGSSRVRTGAVMGAVQSGKTASMIGVLARALDNGVNVAVVLAGTRTSLWHQTLRRVRAQLDAAPQPTKRRIFLPNLGDLEGAHRASPSLAYALTEGAATRALKRGRPIVVVAMKQVDHLLHLGQTLHKVVYPAAARLGTTARLLVIDDEADDSSIADEDMPWTSPELESFKQVPRRILDLWEQRSRPGRTVADHVYAAYVAYTATPQANFLQDPQNPLAPRDFVASLRTPGEHGSLEPRTLTYRVPEGLKGWYTGADIFYGNLASTFCITSRSGGDDDLEEETDSSADEPGDGTSVDEDLVNAVRAYLVAAAVRLSRASGRVGPFSARRAVFATEHEVDSSVAPVTSMLVHPSPAKETHFDVAGMLRRWWDGDGANTGGGVAADLETNERPWTAWVDSYRSSSSAVASRYESMDPSPVDRAVPDWREIKRLLLDEIVPGTKISVINSDPEADDRPEFSPRETDEGWRGPENHSTIFVSGNVMSRGLTLEGLLTTHFSRSSASPLADTQMQMQRWFGYRGSYIDLCRVFLSPTQLSLFTQYADTDHALRVQVLAAMEDSSDSLPDFTVLQGTTFHATGKVSGTSARQLHPGPRPLVRHLNGAGGDDHNLEMACGLFIEAHSRGTVRASARGLVTQEALSLLETADLLDDLRYRSHGRVLAEAQRWAALERQAGLRQADPEFPLYRAPEAADGSVDLGARSPYAIAAYLRFWSAALDRQVRGLVTDDLPPQRWNLLNLDAKRRTQPRFRVGIRFGVGGAIEHGPMADLARTLNQPIGAMGRKVKDDGSLAADWGSRKLTGEGYAGDDLFDYQMLEETPALHPDGTRMEGSPGLLLFQLIDMEDGRGAISVGLSIPSGGPDHVEAVSRARQREAHADAP
jgi:hypothetical protein